MIPNKTRAQKLDDRLRILGFHARASGSFERAMTRKPKPNRRKESKNGGIAGEDGKSGERKVLTQEEKEESTWKRVEASKKRRPDTAAAKGPVDHGVEQRCGLSPAVSPYCRSYPTKKCTFFTASNYYALNAQLESISLTSLTNNATSRGERRAGKITIFDSIS